MTRVGVGAAAVGAAALALGVAARWSAVAVIGAGVGVLVVASAGFVLRRPRLELQRSVEPVRVEKGKGAVMVVRVRNPGRRPLPALALEQRVGAAAISATVPSLRPGEAVVRTYQLPTAVRGEFLVGPLEAPRADAFGLWRRVQHFGHPTRILVHPRLFDLRPLPTGTSRHLEGPSSDTAPQGSVVFHRLREYVAGDDLRSVHWPSTARTGRLVVRHHVDTAQPSTVVLLDVRPDPYPEDTFEHAVDVAASAVVAASAGRAPVQLRTTAGTRLGGPAQRDPLAIVDVLARVEPDADGTLAGALDLLRSDRGGTALVVVTGRLDGGSLPAVAGLRQRYDQVVVASLAAAASPGPAYPGVTVLATPDAAALARAWNSRAVR